MQNAKTEKIKIRIKEIEIDIRNSTDLEISIQLHRQMVNKLKDGFQIDGFRFLKVINSPEKWSNHFQMRQEDRY